MTDTRRAWMAAAAGLCALAVAMGIGRFGYTALLPGMQAAGLSTAGAGEIAAANLLGYMIGSWFWGKTPPAWWGRAYLACLVLSVGSTLVMGLAPSYALWLAGRAAAGPASAGTLVLGTALMLDRLAALHRADLGGFAYCGVGLGIAFSGVAAMLPWTAVDALAGWLLLAAVAAALLPGAALLAHAPATPAPPPAAVSSGPELTRLSIAYTLEGLGYSVTATFLVAVLARGGGITLAAWAWVLAGLAAVPAFFAWRALALRTGVRAALAAAFLVQAVGVGLPSVALSPLAALASAAAFGGTFLAITALSLGEARRLGGIAAIGRITALYGVGQALGPLLAGWSAERSGNFDIALQGSAACICLGALVLTTKTGRRNPCPS
ncbi:MAG: YbfB/YjiJ family MFS transporter [Rhodospirillaceae bacterium]